MIPSSITINYNFTKQLNNIKINPIALHQVVMNLLINAKDAIEDNVGTIDINIHQAYFNNNECISCHQTFAGDFICLEVDFSYAAFKNSITHRHIKCHYFK